VATVVVAIEHPTDSDIGHIKLHCVSGPQPRILRVLFGPVFWSALSCPALGYSSAAKSSSTPSGEKKEMFGGSSLFSRFLFSLYHRYRAASWERHVENLFPSDFDYNVDSGFKNVSCGLQLNLLVGSRACLFF